MKWHLEIWRNIVICRVKQCLIKINQQSKLAVFQKSKFILSAQHFSSLNKFRHKLVISATTIEGAKNINVHAVKTAAQYIKQDKHAGNSHVIWAKISTHYVLNVISGSCGPQSSLLVVHLSGKV